MIKNETVMEVKKGDRSYKLLLDPQSPLGELFDALYEMQMFVVERIKDSQKKSEEISESQS